MTRILNIAGSALLAAGLAFALAPAAQAQDAMTKTSTMTSHATMAKKKTTHSMRSEAMKSSKHDSMGSMGRTDSMSPMGH